MIPLPVIRMLGVFLGVISLIYLFYKELVLTSFDKNLAQSLGISTRWFHYGLTGLVSITIVASFEAVGAILVVGMLILPGATASLISHSLPNILKLSVFLSFIYALLGLHLAFIINCSIASAIIVVAFAILLILWAYTHTKKYLQTIKV